MARRLLRDLQHVQREHAPGRPGLRSQSQCHAGRSIGDCAVFHDNFLERRLAARDVDGQTAPPASSPNYLLSLASVANTLSLWTFHVDWATPANSTLTGPTNLAVAAFN